MARSSASAALRNPPASQVMLPSAPAGDFAGAGKARGRGAMADPAAIANYADAAGIGPAGSLARIGKMPRGAARPNLAAKSDRQGRIVTDSLELAEARIGAERRRGRGALSNASGRYEPVARIVFDDGWQSLEDLPPFRTSVQVDATRKVITRNESPDISFDRSINPYRGCEHGCVYCYARPTHAYLGLSPGLDFESRLFVKPDAPALLERELAAPGYVPRTIAIGTNTDPYQPIEKKYEIMRRVLEVLERAGHPVGIVTKSALVVRDIDILARMAARNLAKVAVSVTTLDPALARTMEPRAATPARRLEALRRLSEAGIPTSVMVAPVIPAINDADIERILDAAAQAGVGGAGYVLLRLPLEVRDLFKEWLMANFPDRYRHVLKLIRDMRGGKDYDSAWGKRMSGTGPYAWMIGRRFEAHCEKIGLNRERARLTTEHFRKPAKEADQLSLF